MEITFSGDSGTLQLFLNLVMDLIWSPPRWTIFAVAVSSPMRDINCRSRQIGRPAKLISLWLGSANTLGWVCLSLFQVALVTYEIEDLFGDQF